MPAKNKKEQKKIIKPKAVVNKMMIMDYHGSHFEEKTASVIEECTPYKHTDTVTWINIDNVPPLKFLHEVSLGFDLHPVIIDDIVNVNQRPKLEILDDYIYLVVKMLRYDEKIKKVISEQVSLVIEAKFVLTFQQGVDGDVFGPLRERIRNNKSRIRNLGTDYLGYALLDAIVDNYFQVLEIYEDQVEQLENDVTSSPNTRTLQKIDKIKREIINIRKMVWPLREVISNLERGETSLIKKSTRIYLRDIYDHIVQVIDSIETMRDLLASMMDIYLSSVSNRTNSVMKVLTVITTIFMPLSFLAGLYGMNFTHMPLLQHPYGFNFMVGLMFLVVATMFLYFMRRKWL